MDLLELKKAEEIRRQIVELERFISYKPSFFDTIFIARKPKFILGLKRSFLFGEQTMEITSGNLSDAIKDALKQTVKNLKTQLVDLGADHFRVSIPYLLGYDTDDKFSDLIIHINEWADDRNLKQADPKIQWMRITEEVGEIRDVLLKPTKFTEPQAALKDAIGDTLVTIIVLAHQLDLDVTECLSIAYEEIKNRKGKMVNGTFVKEEDL